MIHHLARSIFKLAPSRGAAKLNHFRRFFSLALVEAFLADLNLKLSMNRPLLGVLDFAPIFPPLKVDNSFSPYYIGLISNMMCFTR